MGQDAEVILGQAKLRHKREDKTDQAAGNVKDKIGNVKETAEDAVDKVKDKLHKD